MLIGRKRKELLQFDLSGSLNKISDKEICNNYLKTLYSDLMIRGSANSPSDKEITETYLQNLFTQVIRKDNLNKEETSPSKSPPRSPLFRRAQILRQMQLDILSKPPSLEPIQEHHEGEKTIPPHQKAEVESPETVKLLLNLTKEITSLKGVVEQSISPRPSLHQKEEEEAKKFSLLDGIIPANIERSQANKRRRQFNNFSTKRIPEKSQRFACECFSSNQQRHQYRKKSKIRESPPKYKAVSKQSKNKEREEQLCRGTKIFCSHCRRKIG
eukprot:TRINITY_DN67451_c0_g1_i1.p1 TRINITY_DN67451_c0_g1~~TRINITY_DN67451_c0_g1_i1.p1  ORF type:complete len:271 (-),score=22.36 TRINITY_DN67451_c0_g1_i1:43-855(-)